MSDILSRIKAHSRPAEVRRIEVPEWGEDGKPLVICHRMVTLGDLAEVRKVSSDEMRQNAELVAMKACNEDGTPMFRRIDALELMETADPVVLLRVAGQMGASPSVQEAEKN